MSDHAPVPTVTDIIAAEDRAANVDLSLAANQANASTGIYGISGVGKSNLADTAAEYAWEELRGLTMCYAADLGGFGNKRLNLIQQGIMRVYDPSNRVNQFETMELISLGAFPETLIDPERGYAAPDVKLILPRRRITVVYCQQGHVVAKLQTAAEVNSLNAPCPQCGMVVTATTAGRTEQAIVRHPMFKNVVLRIYDSFTGLSDAGLADLQDQSAKGLLPKSGGGGSLLGSADALRSGEMTFGSSSISQYGFVQNRVYGWLKNIRTIPDQKVPAIVTFLVELTQESKRGAGDLHFGPKIAGQAATAALPAKLGNLLHAVKEPLNNNDPASPFVHRLYLQNHISPNDPAKIPYVAKHRGTPLGMPVYLEDKADEKGNIIPWSGFSLNVFFKLLDQQLKGMEKYADAPGMWRGEGADVEDEIVGIASRPAAAAQAQVVSPGRRFRTGPVQQTAVPQPAPVAAAAGMQTAQGVPSLAATQTASPTIAAPAVQQTVTEAARPAVTQEAAPAASQAPSTPPPNSPPPAPAAVAAAQPAQGTPANGVGRRFRQARPPVA